MPREGLAGIRRDTRLARPRLLRAGTAAQHWLLASEAAAFVAAWCTAAASGCFCIAWLDARTCTRQSVCIVARGLHRLVYLAYTSIKIHRQSPKRQMHRSNLDFHGTAQLLRLGIAATVAGADYNPVAAPSEHLAI